MHFKLPPSVSFDQAASIPLGLATAALGLYGGTGYLPSWQDAGFNKYAGKPLVVFGGSTSVGQYGTHRPEETYPALTTCTSLSLSHSICQIVWFQPNYSDSLASQRPAPL